MYTVLIVDDDVETLQGLSNFIDWNAHGFTVVATAQSAEQAMPIIEETRPDVLLTDITMTGSDGFFLLSRARELLPSLEAIILTCHAEFSFAQTAIQSDVAAYLTKVTLTEEELKKALGKVRGRLSDASATLRRQVEKQKTIRDLVSHDGRRFSDMEREGLPLPQRTTAVRVAAVVATGGRTSRPRENTELDDQEWLVSQACPFLPEAHLAFVDRARLLVIDPVFEGASSYASFASCVLELVELVSSRFASDATGSLSAQLPLHGEIRKEYETLIRRFDDAYYEEGNVLLRPTDPEAHMSLSRSQTSLPGEPDSLGDRIAGTDWESAVEQIEASLRSERPDMKVLRPWEDALLRALENKGYELGATLPPLLTTERLSSLIDSLREVARSIEAARARTGTISSRDEINRVARYVRDHIEKPISAPAMAELAGMSLAHFSRLFKRESGLTFSEYLAHKRVEAAKTMLLSGNEVVDEVARATGFENAAYFYRVFKRVTGTTPGDFRQQSTHRHAL